MRCRCRLVKSALCTNFENGSVLGMAIVKPFDAFHPSNSPGPEGSFISWLVCISSETLSRERTQGLEMPYQNYLSLWEFKVMGVIFCELVQFISAAGRGVILVKKGEVQSSLFYSEGSHCLLVLSGHLNSQHIYWETLDFELLFSSFPLIFGKMDYFFACLTGPSADIAGGHVLVLIYFIYSCNNFAGEPSWICLACSQCDAVSRWYLEWKAINTFLSLANEFFFKFQSE